MPRNFQYVSMLRIFSKLERDFDMTMYNEYDVVEWVGEALEAIGTVNQYEEAVSFIEVKNHQCSIPNGLSSIIQLAKNNCWDGVSKQNAICPATINSCISNQPCVPDGSDFNGLSPIMVNNCGQPVPTGCPLPVIIDCNGQPITDYEVAYYRPFFDLQADYFGWCNSSMYKQCFTPIRLSQNSFFDSLVCTETDTNTKQLYRHEGIDEYRVIDGEILRFSFNCGQIALSYRRIKLDEETGYPLIPDLLSVTQALSAYIMMKMQTKEFFKAKEGAASRMQYAEKEWIWYCRQAGNELTKLFGVDDFQDFLDQSKYLVPQKSRYFGFFGKLNHVENITQYDDPNMKNNRLFRGLYPY